MYFFIWTRKDCVKPSNIFHKQMKRDEVIVKRYKEVADDNGDDDYEETMMDYFMKRARIEVDDLDSSEYHHITSYDKKLFHKVSPLNSTFILLFIPCNTPQCRQMFKKSQTPFKKDSCGA